MTVLSVAVPCYNSEEYMDKCIGSLLDSGSGIEILIINDGSKDGTGKIADDYAEAYPGRIKAIHQTNKGHGGAVNTGIANANGHYFKVVDSDDWVNPKVLESVVTKLGAMIGDVDQVDMFITDFVYDKKGATKKKVMSYKGIIPEERTVGWNELGRFRAGRYILMHSVIYRLDVLKNCGLQLPEHTFYVDNLFVYAPLPYVNSIYYMNCCLYHYFIGRDEQSVNESNMIKRIDQQLRVNRLMMEEVSIREVTGLRRRQYMLHYLLIITTVSSVILLKTGTKEAYLKKRQLWQSIFAYDIYLYFRLRTSFLGSIINLPGAVGRFITLFAYKKAQERVGFN